MLLRGRDMALWESDGDVDTNLGLRDGAVVGDGGVGRWVPGKVKGAEARVVWNEAAWVDADLGGLGDDGCFSKDGVGGLSNVIADAVVDGNFGDATTTSEGMHGMEVDTSTN